MKESAAARFDAILDSFGEADPERVRLQEELMSGLLGSDE